jgi:hypothetical protein
VKTAMDNSCLFQNPVLIRICNCFSLFVKGSGGNLAARPGEQVIHAETECQIAAFP